MSLGRRISAVAFLVWVCSYTFAARAGDLTYLVHEPSEKSAHPPLIVLLHGSGADERDMISMAPQLPPTFVVVSPRAPFTDLGGGYRWYRKGGDRNADIAISRRIIDAYIENAVKRFDADPAKLFIGGFSQGAVMTYEVALHEPSRFRGAAVLSGTLFQSGTAGLSSQMDWSRASFFIGHGTTDDRIPFASATAAKGALTRLGVPVSFHAYSGMRHGTGDAEIKDLNVWLASRLGG